MMGDKVTIRTSTGVLYGSFESRDDAWATIERVRKSKHRDAVDGANVVPLLAGVTPMPLHPHWLSDAATPGKLEHITNYDYDVLEQLTAERDKLHDALKLANGTTERRTVQLDEARAEVKRLAAELDALRVRVTAVAELASKSDEEDGELGELARAVLELIGTYGWPADEPQAVSSR